MRDIRGVEFSIHEQYETYGTLYPAFEILAIGKSGFFVGKIAKIR